MKHLTLDQILARTAARKAAGANQTYPEHAGKAKGVASPPVTKPAPKPPGPCRHRGAELTGREREERKLSHGRTWSLCLHPDQPLGEAVCSCKGCGPKCPKYEPPGSESQTSISD